MNHYASPRFWALYEALPSEIRDLADKNYQLLKSDPHHPSLHFKKARGYWSVRVGRNYRALGKQLDDGILWGWIGSHTKYERFLATL